MRFFEVLKLRVKGSGLLPRRFIPLAGAFLISPVKPTKWNINFRSHKGGLFVGGLKAEGELIKCFQVNRSSALTIYVTCLTDVLQ